MVHEILRMQADRTSELERIRQGVKACVVLFPLLGMTWVFGVLSVTDAGLVFQYIFTIVNSLQVFIIGFVIKENCGGDNFASSMIYFPTVHFIIHFLNNRQKKTFSHTVSEENTPRRLVTRQKLNLT